MRIDAANHRPTITPITFDQSRPPNSSIARQTVDRRAAVSKHERRSRTGVFRRRPGPGGGSARPTCAATEPGIGIAHLALAMAHFTLRNHAEAVRWCESAIQVSHRAPIRRALMIACSARAGDMARARAEIAVCSTASRRASSQACSAVKIRYSPAGRHGAPLGRPPPRGTFGVIDRHFRILTATSAVGTNRTNRVWWVAPPHQCVVTMKSVSFPVS